MTMKTIKLNDLNEVAAVSEQDAADVKGGPVYMKFDGVDGSVRRQSGFLGGVYVAAGDING